MGFEPTHAGATILCLNHLTTTAIIYLLKCKAFNIFGEIIISPQAVDKPEFLRCCFK